MSFKDWWNVPTHVRQFLIRKHNERQQRKEDAVAVKKGEFTESTSKQAIKKFSNNLKKNQEDSDNIRISKKSLGV